VILQTRRLGAAAVAAALIAVSLEAVALSAQGRSGREGGSSSSPSRVISPAVVASWVSHSNYADGRMTTLLVLWRGTPGWFASRPARSGGSGGSSSHWGSASSSEYVSFTEGGRTFTMEFDYQHNIVKMLSQEVSLDANNVVLVDFVDGPTGPVIVGYRWVDPVAAPPPAGDPVAAIIKQAPDLFDYLRCDLSVPDAAMNAMLAMVCGRMRP
jgi:hypothetical protein